jgi:hypothetical protein
MRPIRHKLVPPPTGGLATGCGLTRIRIAGTGVGAVFADALNPITCKHPGCATPKER